MGSGKTERTNTLNQTTAKAQNPDNTFLPFQSLTKLSAVEKIRLAKTAVEPFLM